MNTTIIALGAKFDSLTIFSKVEIRRCLTYFVVDNVERNSVANEQCGILCGIEEEIFTQKVKEDIIVALLRDYIKE